MSPEVQYGHDCPVLGKWLEGHWAHECPNKCFRRNSNAPSGTQH